MLSVPLNTLILGALILGIWFVLLWLLGFIVHNRALPTDTNVWVMPSFVALALGRTKEPPLLRTGIALLQPVLFGLGVTIVLRWMRILPEERLDLYMVGIMAVFVLPIALAVGKFRRDLTKAAAAKRSMDYFPNHDIAAEGTVVHDLSVIPPLPFEAPVIPSRRTMYIVPVVLLLIVLIILFLPMLVQTKGGGGTIAVFLFTLFFIILVLSSNINRAFAGPLKLTQDGVVFRSLFGQRELKWTEMRLPDITDREMHLVRKEDKAGYFFRNIIYLPLSLYVKNRYTMHAWNNEPVLVTLRQRLPGMEEMVQQIIGPDVVQTPQADS